MNLDEYQTKAKSTAIYSQDYKMLYPALGIVGECGEVAEKIKKLFRDDGGDMTSERKESIKKELGDSCWYLANICCDTNLNLEMMYKMRGANILLQIRSLTLPQLVLHMNMHANLLAQSLQRWYYDDQGRINEFDKYTKIPQNISHVISCIEEIGRRCDFALKQIYSSNIEKLLSRQKRGVLKGEGDDR